MILYFGQIKLRAYKCRKPKMVGRRGRVWTSQNIIIDGKPVSCTFDSKYGTNLYFESSEVQYYLTMMGQYYDEVSQKINRYSFNPLTEEVQLSTNPFKP